VNIDAGIHASVCICAVAAVCLGHMGHARAAKAVREQANEPQVEANVAQVAIQLGLLNDASRLYQQAGRFDLLATLYQVSIHLCLAIWMVLLIAVCQWTLREFRRAAADDVCLSLESLCIMQNSGQWERAIAVAAKHDHMRVKSTHFAFARHLERVGDVVVCPDACTSTPSTLTSDLALRTFCMSAVCHCFHEPSR
jgi:intraflagellar transport protein 140